MGGDLIREARKRAGLTQRELAERAGTTQSAIARWEAGRSAPSFDTVRRLIRLCGLDLDIMLVPYDDSDILLAQELLGLSIEERARRLGNVVNKLEALRAEVAPQLARVG